MVDEMIQRAACDECTRNCMTNQHQERRGQLSSASRFFKIMHGMDYFEVLYWPPKFARDVRDLAGQKTQIEDSNGKKWTVQVSHVNGILAFHEGWRRFVEDHRLELGELLVFKYVKHGHFVVQIFGRSACEITDFNRGKKHPNKRSRGNQEIIFQDAPQRIIDIDSMDKPLSTPSNFSVQDIQNSHRHPNWINTSTSTSDLGKHQCHLKSKNMEDPSCMLHRDSGLYQVEDRNFLFDLSNCETGKNSCGSFIFENSLAKSIIPVDTQTGEQIEVVGNDTPTSPPLSNKKNDVFCGILTGAFEAKSSGRKGSSNDKPDDVTKLQAAETKNSHLSGIFSDALLDKPSGNMDFNKGMLDDASKFRAGATISNHLCEMFSDELQKIPSGDGGSRNDMTDEVPKFQACEPSVYSHYVSRVKTAAAFKKEVVELEEEVSGFPQVSNYAGIASKLNMEYSQISSPTVKSEPNMGNEFLPAVASSPFSAEVKSQSFLELPLCMNTIQGKRERRRAKVVYLKDSTKHMWPVVYHNNLSFKAFTDGWKTFCKGNNIRVGDVCRFQVENYVPCIFSVDIIRKTSCFSNH